MFRFFGRALAPAALLIASIQPGWTQAGLFPPDRPAPPGALNTIPVPLPPNLADFIKDKKAAIVLGKALFWDQQAGSDGLACASCHFQAGADNRIKNQLNPGFRNEQGGKISQTFNLTASNRTGGPNYTIRKADFPFHQLADPNERNSATLADSDDVMSSQGVFRLDFMTIVALKKGPKDICASMPSVYQVGGVNVRQVEPRNTPTTINAVYNFRNFWDGRANNIFNGRNPFGPRDPSAGVDPLNSILVADGLGNLSPQKVVIPDAALASQAVGPALSDLEMSCRGRVFELLGQKLLRAIPLALQQVDRTDSVLGPYANGSGTSDKPGLTVDYATLIKQAFQPRYWSSTQLTSEGFTQMEKNFSLFWGLSIMMYESTLVSDDSPFDRWASGQFNAMTPQQVAGFQTFNGNAGCIFCHKGPEFTGGASSLRNARDLGAQVEHMLMGDGTVALYDTGFYNIGVRPPVEDIGAGGYDPWGNPLNWARQAKAASALTGPVTNLIGAGADMINVFTCNFQVDPCMPVDPTFRDSVDGSFKVPTLRNVELTGPYFHNGGTATLEQVIDFYNRGGDGKGAEFANTTGYMGNPTNRAPAILPLHLTAAEKANLVAFLKALTDDRVRWEKAPFDHPSLTIPNGHPLSETYVIRNGNTTQAMDDRMTLPAVGAAGRSAKKMSPLVSFDSNLR